MMTLTPAALFCLFLFLNCGAWTHGFTHFVKAPSLFSTRLLENNKEWTSDFDDFNIGDDEEDVFSMSNILQVTSEDRSACQTRQFRLGLDLTLRDFAGSLGFDQVTDWEYYYENEDGRDRKVVAPPPLDPSKPKRTRESSGSVVRIFRGELEGVLGASIRSQGLDNRVLVKEFSGQLALDLARAELQSISKLQSKLIEEEDWVQTASARSVLTRKDNANVAALLTKVQKAPFCGILGEVDLADLEGELDPNEFYRALGVGPPKPGAIWIVYEYTGLSTVASYCLPASVRVSRMPMRRGIFGNPVPPPAAPSFAERAKYVLQGIVKGSLEAVAHLHESGTAHRSIGRSSLILTTTRQDKTEATSPYTTNPSVVVVKLADFGFSGRFEDSTNDPAFLSRSKSFGFTFRKGSTESAVTGFAMAEDLHALGFIILALLLTCLAQVPSPGYALPATDEDTMQRLLDIFDKDMDQFREYVQAEDIWSDLVQLMDERDGWDFMESLLFARERAAQNLEVLTARGLLSSKFLK